MEQEKKKTSKREKKQKSVGVNMRRERNRQVKYSKAKGIALFTTYTWPNFWHVFGNKHPLKDIIYHLGRHRSNKYCFYCMLEERAEELLIEDRGVTIIPAPEEALSQN